MPHAPLLVDLLDDDLLGVKARPRGVDELRGRLAHPKRWKIRGALAHRVGQSVVALKCAIDLNKSSALREEPRAFLGSRRRRDRGGRLQAPDRIRRQGYELPEASFEGLMLLGEQRGTVVVGHDGLGSLGLLFWLEEARIIDPFGDEDVGIARFSIATVAGKGEVLAVATEHRERVELLELGFVKVRHSL